MSVLLLQDHSGQPPIRAGLQVLQVKGHYLREIDSLKYISPYTVLDKACCGVIPLIYNITEALEKLIKLTSIWQHTTHIEIWSCVLICSMFYCTSLTSIQKQLFVLVVCFHISQQHLRWLIHEVMVAYPLTAAKTTGVADYVYYLHLLRVWKSGLASLNALDASTDHMSTSICRVKPLQLRGLNVSHVCHLFKKSVALSLFFETAELGLSHLLY